MKSSFLPAVRVEPDLRRDAESVLDDGESLSDFIATYVRNGIKWRRTQDAFLMRSQDAIDRALRDGSGISPQELLKRVDDRLDEARRRLSGRLPPSR